MAQGIEFTCEACGLAVWAWDDGNPYYVDRKKMLAEGRPRSRCKGYVHHPEIPPWPVEGNDVPHICLDCAHLFNVDTALERTTCTKCRSSRILDCCRLEGCSCPRCGKAPMSPGGFAVS